MFSRSIGVTLHGTDGRYGKDLLCGVLLLHSVYLPEYHGVMFLDVGIYLIYDVGMIFAVREGTILFLFCFWYFGFSVLLRYHFLEQVCRFPCLVYLLYITHWACIRALSLSLTHAHSLYFLLSCHRAKGDKKDRRTQKSLPKRDGAFWTGCGH